MKRIRTFATLGALAVAAAVAVPAEAAAPVTVGPGHPADIAVEPSGTAHIARHTQNADPHALLYCQLPRGGASCINTESLFPTAAGTPNSIFGRVHVFLTATAGEVVLFEDRCCEAPGTLDKSYTYRSTNGGLDFGTATLIGSFDSGSADEAVYGPGVSITAITEIVTAGTFVQNSSIFGPQQMTTAELQSNISAEGAIGFDPATLRPVAVFIDQSTDPHRLLWRKFKDSVAITSANINNELNWDPEQLILTDSAVPGGPALAVGGGGLFLLYEDPTPNADRLLVTKYTARAGGPATQIGETASINDMDLSQDAGGRLHAVWHNNTTDTLRYTFSDDGVNWSKSGDLHRGLDYSSVRVAAAADHQGFAVWSDTSGEGTVQAVPLELLPEPPDVDPPTVGNLGIGDPTLTPGQATSFTFTSSEAGNAVLTFQKRFNGKKVKKKGKKVCKKVGKKKFKKLKKKKRCKGFKKIGEIRQAVTPGTNTIAFGGRIAGRKLGKGVYRARLVVIDLAGNVARTETITFKVVGKKKKKKKK